MDIGKLLANRFSDKHTAENSAKAASEERVRTAREWRDRNFESIKALFSSIVQSFNESVGAGSRLTMDTKGYDIRFDHGFSVVLLLQIGEAHVELSRGGAHGRKTLPFPKSFFFISYDADGAPIFSESYHIESAWITGDEFAAFCLREALGIE